MKLTVSSGDRSLSTSLGEYLDTMYNRTYNMNVNFEWDPAKAASNLEAHGVDFADAAVALEDDRALTVEDTRHDGEQ